jgi:hypothetical protein
MTLLMMKLGIRVGCRLLLAHVYWQVVRSAWRARPVLQLRAVCSPAFQARTWQPDNRFHGDCSTNGERVPSSTCAARRKTQPSSKQLVKGQSIKEPRPVNQPKQ